MADVSEHSKDQNNYPVKYAAAHKRFEAHSTTTIDNNRFVNFEERDTQSVLTVDIIKIICHGKLNWLWNTYVSFMSRVKISDATRFHRLRVR